MAANFAKLSGYCGGQRAADRVVDKTIPPEERERRKRALIKWPKEFRDIREDQPKSKT